VQGVVPPQAVAGESASSELADRTNGRKTNKTPTHKPAFKGMHPTLPSFGKGELI